MSKYVAPVTLVNLGSVCVAGVLLEDGTFGVTAQQANELLEFSAHPRNVSKSLKALPSASFRASIKVRTEENSNPSLIIPIDLFEKVIADLARKGNQKAFNLLCDLAGLSLQQLFCDAFNIHFDKQDREQWLTTRQKARENFKPGFTDFIKAYGNKHDITPNYAVEVNKFKKALNLPLTGIDEYGLEDLERWKDGLFAFKYLTNLVTPKEAYRVIAEMTV